MRPLYQGVTLWLLALLASRGASVLIADARTQQCTPGWGPPRELVVGPQRLAAVDHPNIVRLRAGVGLVGPTMALEFDADSAKTPTTIFGGLLLRDGGKVTLLPLPPGTTTFMHPRVTTDGNGHAHVLWGTAGDSARRARGEPDTVWYAQFDGTTWTRPEVVLSDLRIHRLQWNGAFESLFRASDSVLFAAIPGPDSIYVVSRRAEHWKHEALPVGTSYTALAGDAHGGVVMAFSPARRPDGRLDISGTYVSRFRRGRWSEPALVRRALFPTSRALENLYLLSSHRELYLLQADGDSIPDLVSLLVSSDGGASWRALPSLRITGGVHGMQAIVDSRGVIRVVGTATLGGGALVTATWNGQQWTSGPPSFNPTASTSIDIVAEPTLAALPADSVFFTWSVMRSVRIPWPGVPGVPVTMYTVYRRCGGRSSP